MYELKRSYYFSHSYKEHLKITSVYLMSYEVSLQQIMYESFNLFYVSTTYRVTVLPYIDVINFAQDLLMIFVSIR